MDTKKFQHDKNSSVTVVIDRPQYAEVRIPIHAYIRTDVVLAPGGNIPAADAVKNFLGRPYNTNAFKERLAKSG